VLIVTLVSRLAWRAWPFELLSNFPIQLAGAAALVLLYALVVRGWITVAVAALALTVNVAVARDTISGSVRPARPGGTEVTIGHLNAQTRHIDTAALGRYLLDLEPDVFVILDPTQSDVGALTRIAPGFRVERVGSLGADPDYVRVVVLSRVPLRDLRHPQDPAFGESAVEGSIDVAGSPIAFTTFGSEAPTTPARAHRRDQVLGAAARWSRARSPRRVVFGDLNTTPWSPSFRDLLQSGRLHDSLQGFGLQVTWPVSNPLVRIPIDHALLGPALTVTDRGTGPSFGSEHRSLHFTVAPAA
jgi:hypothetical protein